MPISTYTEYKKRAESSKQWSFYKGVNNITSGAWGSHMTVLPDALSTPTTAVLCDGSTPGAILQQPKLGSFTNPLYLAGIEYLRTTTAGNTLSLMLAQRAAHNGGLSGIVTTAQTTNLPTPTLTNVDTTVGVMIGLQVYTALGATTTTVTASYTNSSGTAGRTTQAVATLVSMAAGSMLILPLQDGDVGVNSVQSVTLAATTGTAGNFGVVLFKPIAMLPFLAVGSWPGIGYRDGIIEGCGNLSPIRSNACLDIMNFSSSTAGLTGFLSIIEG